MNQTILIADQKADTAGYYRSLLQPDTDKISHPGKINGHEPSLTRKDENPELQQSVSIKHSTLGIQHFHIKIFPDAARLKEYFSAEYRDGRRIPLSILNVGKDFAQVCRTAGLLMDTDPATMIVLISDGSDLSPSDRQRLKPGIYYIEQALDSKKLASMIQTLLRNRNEREQSAFRPKPFASPKYQPPLLSPDRKTVFDESGVAERMGNNRKLIRMMLKTFVQNIPGQISRLKEDLKVKDAEAVWKMGHTLKGSSATAGATAMQDTALRIEKAGKAGNLEEAASLTYHLENEFEELKQFVWERGFI